MDSATQRNLELVQTLQGDVTNSLFALLDNAQTAMGSRIIKQWVIRPLRTQQLIANRHDCVHYFVEHIAMLQQLNDLYALAESATGVACNGPWGDITVHPRRMKVLEVRQEGHELPRFIVSFVAQKRETS